MFIVIVIIAVSIGVVILLLLFVIVLKKYADRIWCITKVAVVREIRER
jgi:hypothetical protein